MKKPEIVIAADPSAMAETAAVRIASVIHDAVDARGRCSMCLAGGGTPRAVHEILGKNDMIPWDKVDFYFGDERCVAPDDKDSNYRMANESLLGPRRIAEDQIKRMKAEEDDRDAAADAYANLAAAYSDGGRVDDAITCYRKALALRPDFPDAFANLVFALAAVCDWRARDDDLAKLRALLAAQLGVDNALPSLQPFAALAFGAAAAQRRIQ